MFVKGVDFYTQTYACDDLNNFLFVFQYYYSVYCMGYALYLLLVVLATEWFMGHRFLTYGYVTMANQVSFKIRAYFIRQAISHSY